MRRLRRRMQIVFQDPASSLDPRQRIGEALGEPLRVTASPRGGAEGAGRRAACRGRAAATAAARFPTILRRPAPAHRHRPGARARARLIFATSRSRPSTSRSRRRSCGCSNRSGKSRNLAFVFISHDLGVVRHFCQRVTVMYLGRVVESGPVARSSASRCTPIPSSSGLLAGAGPGAAGGDELQEGEPPLAAPAPGVATSIPAARAPSTAAAPRRRLARGGAGPHRGLPPLRRRVNGGPSADGHRPETWWRYPFRPDCSSFRSGDEAPSRRGMTEDEDDWGWWRFSDWD